MPLFYLELAAELENVKELTTSGVDRWAFHVRCTHCNEAQEKAIYIEKDSTSELPGSRGEAHLVMKCKYCERVSSIEWIEHKKGVKVGNVDKSDTMCRVLALECRGLEPFGLEVEACAPMALISSKDNVVEDVVIDEGDFADYDDEGDVSVCIYKLKSQFVRG